MVGVDCGISVDRFMRHSMICDDGWWRLLGISVDRFMWHSMICEDGWWRLLGISVDRFMSR